MSSNGSVMVCSWVVVVGCGGTWVMVCDELSVLVLGKHEGSVASSHLGSCQVLCMSGRTTNYVLLGQG